MLATKVDNFSSLLAGDQGKEPRGKTYEEKNNECVINAWAACNKEPHVNAKTRAAERENLSQVSME